MKVERVFKVEYKDIIWENFQDLCKGCGLCVARCPQKCLKFSRKDVGFLGTPSIECDVSKCTACKVCEKNCPDCAIRIEGNFRKRP